nr:MAG TPA: hypothetical protein [Caudoviricetes sp.]
MKRSFQTVFYLFILFQFRFEELLEFIKRNFARVVVVFFNKFRGFRHEIFFGILQN